MNGLMNKEIHKIGKRKYMEQVEEETFGKNFLKIEIDM